jgi:NADH dehydrogenase
MLLVTGSTGFIGRSLCDALKQQERPFRAFSGRINDPSALRAELIDIDTVIHLAGAEARDRVRLLQRVDVQGTELLLDESRRADVRRLIVISRLNVDASSMYALLRAKGEMERLVRRGGIPYTIIRSATLFGRDDRFLNVIAALAGWSWPFVWLPGGGRVAMQPLWVEDLIHCLMLSLERNDLENSMIEVAGEERMRYEEIARITLRAAGIKRRPIAPAVKLLRPISALLFGWWLRPPITRFGLDRFSVPEVAPVDSVYQSFGFRPTLMHRQIAYLRGPGTRRRLFRHA